MITIVLIGPESTAKTSLVKQLASDYKTLWQPEYLREFYDLHDGIKENQMKEVAFTQCNQEKILIDNNSEKEVIFFDTNIISLKIYYEYYFKQKAKWFNSFYQPLSYTHYFLLDTHGIPWTSDPQRDSPEAREKLFFIFKNELDELEVNYSLITGNYGNRLIAIKNIIDSNLLPKSF